MIKVWRWVAFSVLLAVGTSAQAQEQTVGLFLYDERAYEGYTLLTPLTYPATYLLDNDGRIVHQWEHDVTSVVTYFLEDGSLLRTGNLPNETFMAGGRAGRVREIDWEGNVVWTFEYSDSLHALHHDIERLPNGNILMIAWERKTAEEAIAAGRDPDQLSDGELWPDHVIEVEPTPPVGGNIVWEWHAWDHLIQDFDANQAHFGVVADHPELIDINVFNGPGADWLHVNSIDYNAALDQIIIGSPALREFWVIDHSTTTDEAAGHTGGQYGRGGDVLYRWGNPAVYQAGTADDQRLFGQHDAQWIEEGLSGAGNILVFNNGPGRPEGNYSTVIELVPPVEPDGSYAYTPGTAYGPAAATWTYQAETPEDFYSPFISGAQRLPNGNTLICSGSKGRIFEVTPAGEIVWEYISPVIQEGPLMQGVPIPEGGFPGTLQNTVFRAYRYGTAYPGLEGKELTPMGTVEVPTDIDDPVVVPTEIVLIQNYPNPARTSTTIRFEMARPARVSLAVFNALGQRVATLADGAFYGAGVHTVPLDASGLPSGVYVYRLEADGYVATKTLLRVK